MVLKHLKKLMAISSLAITSCGLSPEKTVYADAPNDRFVLIDMPENSRQYDRLIIYKEDSNKVIIFQMYSRIITDSIDTFFEEYNKSGNLELNLIVP